MFQLLYLHILIVGCCLPTLHCQNYDVDIEAQSVALNYFGDLLPPDELVESIKKDLHDIRSKYPCVADIKHIPEWDLGSLMFNKDTTSLETLEKINSSRFGPVKVFGVEPWPKDDAIYTVKFLKPYNSKMLGALLRDELGIKGAHVHGPLRLFSKIYLSRGGDKIHLLYYFDRTNYYDCEPVCPSYALYRIFKVAGESAAPRLDWYDTPENQRCQ